MFGQEGPWGFRLQAVPWSLTGTRTNQKCWDVLNKSGLLHFANFSWTLNHWQESTRETEPWRTTSVTSRGKEVHMASLLRWLNSSHQVCPWDYLWLHDFKINPNFSCNSVCCLGPYVCLNSLSKWEGPWGHHLGKTERYSCPASHNPMCKEMGASKWQKIGLEIKSQTDRCAMSVWRR